MDASFILATLLLTAPPQQQSEAKVAAWVSVLKPSLLAAAIADEVLDEREFVMPDVLTGEQGIQWLQGRWQDLRDAPRLGELARWPDRGTLCEMLSLNRTMRSAFAARLPIDAIFEDDLRAAISDLDCEYSVLDSLRDSQAEAFYVHVRRDSLRSFRDRIGPAAWSAGELSCARHLAPEPAVMPDLRKRLPVR